MAWNRHKERPLLYIVSWTWDSSTTPVSMALVVEGVPIVRETKCRWYLAHAPQRTRWYGLKDRAFISKDHSGTLFVASPVESAALRLFAGREALDAEHYASLAANLNALIREARGRAERLESER